MSKWLKGACIAAAILAVAYIIADPKGAAVTVKSLGDYVGSALTQAGQALYRFFLYVIGK